MPKQPNRTSVRLELSTVIASDECAKCGSISATSIVVSAAGEDLLAAINVSKART